MKLGIIPGFGGTQRLPRLVGKGAYRIGLVNEVVPAEQLIPRAEALLRQISANAALSIRFAVGAMNKGLETSQAEGLALESSFFAIRTSTADKNEGTSALLEKRAPKFQGA